MPLWVMLEKVFNSRWATNYLSAINPHRPSVAGCVANPTSVRVVQHFYLSALKMINGDARRDPSQSSLINTHQLHLYPPLLHNLTSFNSSQLSSQSGQLPFLDEMPML